MAVNMSESERLEKIQRARDKFGAKDSFDDLFKKRRREGVLAVRPAWRRAKANHEFAAPGEEQLPYDPEHDSERGRGRSQRRKFTLMAMNQVHPIVSTMAGRQIMSRFERRYIPRNRDVARWAELMGDIDRAVMDGCHGEQEDSAAFRNGPGIGGVAWVSFKQDYLEDPEGKIVLEEIPVWQMLWPARDCRRKNLVDRDWHIRGQWVTKGVFASLWPSKVKQVKKELGNSPKWSATDFGGSNQGESSPVPWEGMGGSSEDEFLPFYDMKKDRLWVEHYECREPEIRFFVSVPVDPNMSYKAIDEMAASGTGSIDQLLQTQEMSPDEFRDFKERHETIHGEEVPPLRYITKERYVYRQTYYCGDIKLEPESEIPIGRWTYEAVTGYPFVQAEKVEWRSVVDSLRTPQVWINIFLTMLAKYIQVNPKGVLFVERGVFRSRNEGLTQFAGTGGIVEVERGKLSGSQNPPFQFHTGGPSPMGGFIQGMLEFSQSMLPQLAGFNAGALGQLGPDLRRISGTVVEHVRDAAVAAQGELYDSFSLYRQRAGQIILAMIPRTYDMERLQSIVGYEKFYETPTGPDGQPVVDPETGQPQQTPVIPPASILDDAVWQVSVEETKPAPDRLRFFWESLTESGALKILLEQGVFTAEDVAEIAPDLDESRRKKMLDRIKQTRAQQAMQPAQPQQSEGAPS